MTNRKCGNDKKGFGTATIKLVKWVRAEECAKVVDFTGKIGCRDCGVVGVVESLFLIRRVFRAADGVGFARLGF